MTWWSPCSSWRYVRRRLGDEELRTRWPGTDEGYALLSGILG